MWAHRDMKIQIPHYLGLTRVSIICIVLLVLGYNANSTGDSNAGSDNLGLTRLTPMYLKFVMR